MKSSKGDQAKNSKKDDLPGYPIYPASDDIYTNEEKVDDIDSEDNPKISSAKDKKKLPGKSRIGDDLDVPGAELDDDMEDIGEEDEENNYYSLGGDNHADLDEYNADEDPDITEKED